MTSQLEREPVIVFACGRSGSTLLIRILNCLPKTVVWGEHGGILKPVFASYTLSREVAGITFITDAAKFLPDILSRSAITRRGMSIEWLNWFKQDDIDELYRDFVIKLFYPVSIQTTFDRWGFKELRYRAKEYETLNYLFPQWRPIILFRNPVDVFASQLKSFAKGDTSRIPQLTEDISGFYTFAANICTSSDGITKKASPFFTDYETMVWQFDEAIASLRNYLGEQFSSQLQLIRAEVKKFSGQRPRREEAAASEVEQDLEAWATSMGVAIPPEKREDIARNYDTLTSLAAGQSALP